ncbi:HNH endonuclease signature motif containing protein [Amycolatopsis nigrescens]|uniref:HNH endonuclease signature motif containing protein n=1 Tax=Amycolatopsis nigrescens TaxID=381445 RepID=UPI00037564FE|nr:HNH endonuclease signature motif containing protein [Amycolatopsis nigrescens]
MTSGNEASGGWWRLDGRALVAELLSREREKRRLDAEQGQILAELDRRGVREATGYGTLAALLQESCHVSAAEARARVARARALNPGRDFAGTEQPALATATALAAMEGALGAGQIDAILAILGQLPDSTAEHEWGLGEKILVDLARTAGPREIAVAGWRLLTRLDPDGPEPNHREPVPARRKLAFVTHRDGSHGLKATLDDETFARLKAALDPLAKPRPATPEEGPDTRGQGERYGDAFAEFVGIGMANPDLPGQAGDTTHIVVTLSYDDLRRELGRACLDLVGDISATEARLLACDATIIPVVLGSHGEPLDVGRAQRLATPAQRRALAIRDGGCAFPGCDAPPQRCTAHHIVFWAHHGETKIGNLVLLCARHHRLIHHSDWAVRLAADGHPEFIPPGFLDPTRAPRRNTMHPPPRSRTGRFRS